MTDLNPETKAQLEKALMERNKEWEKAILNKTTPSLPSPSPSEAGDVELCCICFERVYSIEIRACGHQMCDQCTLALYCHKKLDLTTAVPEAPSCPFCRCSIANLVAVKVINDVTEMEVSHSNPRRSKKSRNSGEGSSSSFMGLSTMGSFVKIGGRNSGKLAAECNEAGDKFLQMVAADPHSCLVS